MSNIYLPRLFSQPLSLIHSSHTEHLSVILTNHARSRPDLPVLHAWAPVLPSSVWTGEFFKLSSYSLWLCGIRHWWSPSFPVVTFITCVPTRLGLHQCLSWSLLWPQILPQPLPLQALSNTVLQNEWRSSIYQLPSLCLLYCVFLLKSSLEKDYLDSNIPVLSLDGTF